VARVEPAHRIRLLGRQDLGGDVVDAQALGNGVGHGLTVAGDHRDADPKPMKVADGLA